MVVLPTGMGKTLIAILMAMHRIKNHPGSKVVMVSPTRPLVQQHFNTFKKHLDIPQEQMVMFTGNVPPKKRQSLWETAKIIFSTPQGFENDVISGKLDIEQVSLIIFDEAHRAVGDYAYVLIADRYFKKAKFPRVLALTASPGADKQKILEVCDNLDIEKVEIRTAQDPDVSPYIQKTDIKYVEVDFPEEFKKLQDLITQCSKGKLEQIKEMGYLNTIDINKMEMLKLQRSFQGMLARGEKDYSVMKAVSLLAEATKIQHALELLETQGLPQTLKYLEKIEAQAPTAKTKAVRNLVRDILFRQSLICARELSKQALDHPKKEEVKRLVDEQVKQNQDAKIIIFTQYRDSADELKTMLDLWGVESRVFVGQQKKEGKGMSQKQQIETINEFKLGLFNVLICTSVAEEGLDIPRVDVVLFYEPIPSAIRTIQRRGRTGRQEQGKVLMLVTKGTRDVGYRWSAHHKEKRMYRILNQLRDTLPLELAKLRGDSPDKNQSRLHTFEKVQRPKIIADYREKGSPVIKQLLNDADLGLEHLNVGDFILSERVAVEYKTVEDFVASIIDGRLLEQARSLRRNFQRPILIIEGDQDIYSVRKIHPNAIRGMMATLLISFGIPLMRTSDPQETAALLHTMAKREQELLRKHPNWHGAKRQYTTKEQMEYIASSLPGIGPALAAPLLKEFKSLKNLVNASDEDWQKVKLIGPAKAKQLRQVLEADYFEELDREKA